MAKEYRSLFKCRLCGETYESVGTVNKEIAMNAAISACLGKPFQPQAPALNEVHVCKDGGFGIADFQRFTVRDLEEP